MRISGHCNRNNRRVKRPQSFRHSSVHGSSIRLNKLRTPLLTAIHASEQLERLRPGRPRLRREGIAQPDREGVRQRGDREAMFATPEYVFKNGELVVKNGKVVKVVQGATHVVRPDFDKSIEKPLNDYFDRYLTVRMENFKLHDEEIIKGDKGAIVIQPTKARAA